MYVRLIFIRRVYETFHEERRMTLTGGSDSRHTYKCVIISVGDNDFARCSADLGAGGGPEK